MDIRSLRAFVAIAETESFTRAGQRLEISQSAISQQIRTLETSLGATLFARQDVVEAAWAIVDPVIHGPSPLYEYEPGTWGPKEAEALTASVGGWNTPK